MRELSASIREYYDNVTEPVDAAEILASSDRRQGVPNWVVAVGAAVAVFIRRLPPTCRRAQARSTPSSACPSSEVSSLDPFDQVLVCRPARRGVGSFT
jgi:hypothetical protein